MVEAPANNSRLILQGPTGSGKSTLLLKRYRYMVEDLHLPSENILILVLNRTQSLEWRTKTVLKGSGAVWRTSYYGFIQSELRNYYPMVREKCGEILSKDIKPVFLTFESAQFLLSKVIEDRRQNRGFFSGVTAYSDRIAIDLASNLVKASISDIPYNQIGSRLYNALEKKDELKKQMYSEADDIIKAYRAKCMELGVYDFGMAVEMYNNCLLNDKCYRELLTGRVQHLIVDNIEECVPTAIDFIDSILPDVRTCLLGYNDEGGYGLSFGGNHYYTKQKLLSKCRVIELGKSYTCKDYMYEFSDMLFDTVNTTGSVEKRPCTGVERVPAFELRSEMLEKIGERICSLIENEGYKPTDIVVLSTYADPVTEFVIDRILERRGHKLKNLTRKSRVIDNPFSQALITLAQLCHPRYRVFPNRDDVKALIRLLLSIDPVRSSILAGEVCSQRPFAAFPDVEFPGLVERIGYYNVEKYEYIRNWIDEYKNRPEPLPVNEFLQKVFLEILLSREVSEKDILQAKNLIDSAQSFVDIVSRFNRNAGKDFLDMIRNGIKAAESIFELEEKLTGDFVLLATPVPYLASSLKSKVTILCGISSDNWTPRSAREMTNSHVLTKTWDESSVYTEEIEEVNQKHYLAVVMRAMLKRTEEKLITFESSLSANGFENDGLLSEYFDEIIG